MRLRASRIMLVLGGLLAALPFAAASLDLVVSAAHPGLRSRGIKTYLHGLPLTGLVYSFHRPFVPEMLTFFYEGRPHGTEIFWYADGVRELERRYWLGMPHGVHQSWFASGRIKTFRTYVNGKADGEQWAWYPDGQVQEYNRYADGVEIAHKTWTYDGKPFHNYVFQGGKRVGIQGEDFCRIRKRSKL